MNAVKLQSWELSDNYHGPDYSNYYVGFSTHRDADILTQANFDACKERLEKYSGVEVINFSHWACGWGSTILVKKTAKRAVNILQKIMRDYKDYPVIDEDLFHQYESDRRDDDFKLYQDDWSKEVAEFFGLKTFEKTEMLAVLSVLHDHACGWSGVEDAFISKNYIPNIARSYEMNELAKEGNSIAQIINKQYPYK